MSRANSRRGVGRAFRTWLRSEDAERFVEEVRSDDPELATYLRIEEREKAALELVRDALSPEVSRR